jgi:3-methyladenine DNA glycosylase AlkD
LGLSRAQVDLIIREFAREAPKISSIELNTLADDLWEKGETYDERAIAISLLNRYSKLLDDETWYIVDRWVEQASGWGLCDALGSGPIATMLHKDLEAKSNEILRWTRSKNFWRRRIALYALRDFVFSNELDFPFITLKHLIYDREFWVQRAAGTWLRECWKKDRKRTEEFLIDNSKGLPRVVITVATERASKSFREELRRIR